MKTYYFRWIDNGISKEYFLVEIENSKGYLLNLNTGKKSIVNRKQNQSLKTVFGLHENPFTIEEL